MDLLAGYKILQIMMNCTVTKSIQYEIERLYYMSKKQLPNLYSKLYKLGTTSWAYRYITTNRDVTAQYNKTHSVRTRGYIRVGPPNMMLGFHEL